MADTDTSSYILRYNLVSGVPEYFNGSDWYMQNAGMEILTLNGAVTGTGSGTITTTLANNAVSNVNIASAAAIAFSKLAPLTSSHLLVGNVSNVATDVALSGDATLSNAGALTLATVNGNVGSFTSANITVDAKGRITAASNGSGGSSGAVVQVITVNQNASSPTSNNTNTFIATGLTATITPTSASNNIRIRFTGVGRNTNTATDNLYLTVYRSGFGNLSTDGSNAISVLGGSASAAVISVLTGEILDTPATTSALTYTVYLRSDAAGATVVFPYIGMCSISLEELVP